MVKNSWEDDFMKRFSAIFLSVIILLTSFISVYAVKVNGIDDGFEWMNIDSKVFISSKHSNNVDFAAMKHQVIDEYEVCFYFYLSDINSESIDKSGFIITVFDDLTVTVDANGTSIDGDANNYYIDAEIAFIEDTAVSCEIVVGCKNGLPESVCGSVSFVDGQGVSSYYYPFNISMPINNATTAPIKTDATSKAERTSERTTKVKTTASQTTSNAEKTKVEKTTVEKTTKKASQTKKQDKTYVYFYEKEVIISQVIVTQPTEITSVTNVNDDILLSQQYEVSTGFKIQRVVVFGGIIMLVIGGAIAGMSISKSKSNDKVSDNAEVENKESDETK